MSGFWSWLSEGRNQKTLGFIGTGILAALGLGWQLFVYFDEPGDGDGNSAMSSLLAPVPLQPRCDSVIAWPGTTRTLTFNWRNVEDASSYSVEVDCFGCGQQGQWFSSGGRPWHVRTGLGFRTGSNPIYASQVPEDWRAAGGTGLRWRVWAVDENDRSGHKSPWCAFSFFGNIE